MARPSVADERREQIIVATLSTISQHGISGTTLDRIADTAGMSRGHVRHFVGNRDRLLLDAARAFYGGDDGEPTVMPREILDLESALDFLFGDEFSSSSAENAIVLAFVELARSNPEIAEVLTAAYSSARARLTNYVAVANPNASRAAIDVVAQGVLSAALGNVFIGDFDREPGHTELTKAAAEALIRSL